MSKVKKIFSELSTIFDKSDNNLAINIILGIMKLIRIDKKSLKLSKMYNCKMSSWQVLNLLLVFPFFSVKNALQYESSMLGRYFRCKKDMFYDFLNSDLLDWRKILDLMNRQLLRIISRQESKCLGVKNPAAKDRSVRCLVVDDTTYPRLAKRWSSSGRSTHMFSTKASWVSNV